MEGHLIFRKSKEFRLLVFLASLSLCGGTVLAISTRWGAGVSPDSVVYISAARNLSGGHGLTVSYYPGVHTPMTYYPPLLPTLLGSFGLLGMDPLAGASWLNDVLFAANIALVGLMVHALTQSLWVSLLGSLFTMISFPIVQIHSMAWSEPLFIFVAFLGMLFLVLYLERQRHLLLIASSVAVGLAFLTRYVGLAIITTGVGGIFLLSHRPWKKRFADAIVFCAVSSTPTLLWMIRNLAVAGSTTGREIIFHPLTQEHLESTLNVISTWVLSKSFTPILRWTGLLVVGALLVALFLRDKGESGRDKKKDLQGRIRAPTLICLFIVNYAIFLVISLSFVDAYTPIDNRILSPVYLAGLVLTLCLLANSAVALRHRQILRLFLIVCLVVFSTTQLMQSLAWLRQSYNDGFGYASRVWKESQTIKHLALLDPCILIFTNGPDAVYVLTGRRALMIPRKANPGTRVVNSNYSNEISEMKRVVKEGKAVLVYFNSIAWRWYLPSESEVKEELGLSVRLVEKDGSIYPGVPQSKAKIEC